MLPVDREKRWLKLKGCRNAARMWRADLDMWVFVPMNPDKDFKIVPPKFEPRKIVFKKHVQFEPFIIKSSPEQKKRHQMLARIKAKKEKMRRSEKSL